MEEVAELAAKSAKDARKAMLFTGLAVLVAVAVLAIDNTIKRAIVSEAAGARQLLDEFRALVAKHTVSVEVRPDGAEEAGKAGAGTGNGVNPGDGVVHDAPAGEVLDSPADAAKPAPAKRTARAQRGPSGDG
jgi:hypothetical protein